MALNDAYKILLRQRILEKLSDEERKALAFLNESKAQDNDIKEELRKIEELVAKNKYSFGLDFLSNVAGNAAFDGFVYILSRLAKRIRP